MTLATESRPVGYWTASGNDLTPDIADQMRDLLPQAVAEGKEIVVIGGVTLRWVPAETVLRDPEDRWRLARISTDFISQFGLRMEGGAVMTAEWGEPDVDGIYEPTFTAHRDPTPPEETT